MSQAGLTTLDPVLINTVAITDQNTLPLRNQMSKGFFGALGMNKVKGDGVRGHGPKPLQGVLTIPRRLVDVAHRVLARHGSDGLVVRPDGL